MCAKLFLNLSIHLNQTSTYCDPAISSPVSEFRARKLARLIFTRDNHNKRGKREKEGVVTGLIVTPAGLTSTACPGLYLPSFPLPSPRRRRRRSRPRASMKESYTGDESTWIHRDDDLPGETGWRLLRQNSLRSESLHGERRKSLQ